MHLRQLEVKLRISAQVPSLVNLVTAEHGPELLVTVAGLFLWLSLAAWLVSSAMRMPLNLPPLVSITGRPTKHMLLASAHMVYRGTSDQNDRADRAYRLTHVSSYARKDRRQHSG